MPSSTAPGRALTYEDWPVQRGGPPRSGRHRAVRRRASVGAGSSLLQMLNLPRSGIEVPRHNSRRTSTVSSRRSSSRSPTAMPTTATRLHEVPPTELLSTTRGASALIRERAWPECRRPATRGARRRRRRDTALPVRGDPPTRSTRARRGRGEAGTVLATPAIPRRSPVCGVAAFIAAWLAGLGSTPEHPSVVARASDRGHARGRWPSRRPPHAFAHRAATAASSDAPVS